MSRHYYAVSTVARMLGHGLGRVYNAMEKLGIQPVNPIRDGCRKQVPSIDDRQLRELEKYFDANRPMNTVDAAKEAGITKERFWRTAKMLNLGPTFTFGDVQTVKEALKRRAAGEQWYLIRKVLGRALTPNTLETNELAGSVFAPIPYVTLKELVTELPVNYNLLLYYVNRLPVEKIHLPGQVTALSPEHADLVRAHVRRMRGEG